MGDVIRFDDLKKQQAKSTQDHLDPDKLKYYENLLAMQVAIMIRLFKQTEEKLRNHGFDLSAFSLDEESANEFMRFDMGEVMRGGINCPELIFNGEVAGIKYKAYAAAVNMNQDIRFDVWIMKYNKESDEWAVYA